MAVRPRATPTSNGAGEIVAHPPTTPVDTRHHGAPVRGLDVVPSSSFLEGRFGRMFRHLPVFDHAESDLVALAHRMVQRREKEKPEGEEDDDENTAIPAGYTYLGQFIDHDLTFDPASSLQRQKDPDALHDFRTPRFDLDSLYGRGPADQPYLYRNDAERVTAPGAQRADLRGIWFLLGEPVARPGDPTAGPDLPRNMPRTDSRHRENFRARALIGDPRNDVNLIVSQLHTIFLKFHNQMAVRVAAETRFRQDNLFKETQRLVRWHYQWVVLHDFLPRVASQQVVQDILREETYATGPGDRTATIVRPRLLFYEPREAPYMPVEFSVAAYRFGHSMIRPSYHINDVVRGERGGQRIPIFSPVAPEVDERQNLNGFRRLPHGWGIEWKFFFDIAGADREGQHSYKIDPELGNPLGHLPREVAKDPSSLALRNLLRAKHLGLPSGQSVARAMGIAPLSARRLELSGDLGRHAPLWYYVLKEAEKVADGKSLGPVGGRIVAEVLIGLLAADPLSYLSVEPGWRPPLANENGEFGMPELVRFATGE
ncbi:MAG: peroxidase family protein [Solirubrobacteraceae bacterium]